MRRYFSRTAGFAGFIFILFAFEKTFLGKEKFSPVTLVFMNAGGEEISPMVKQDEKVLRKYFKEKGIAYLTKDMAAQVLQKEYQEITQPYIKEGTFMKNEARIKERMSTVPEVTRWTTITLFGETASPDSAAFSITNFPWNKNIRISHKRSFLNDRKAPFAICLQSWLDSCITLGYFKR